MKRRRVRGLREKAIDYVLTATLLHTPGLFAIHPFGKMPVLC